MLRMGMLGLLAALAVFGLGQAQTNVNPEVLYGITAKRAMGIANTWGAAGASVKSFVTPDAVQFGFQDGKTVSVALPKDQMVVAVAPYLRFTHPCKTHYMSSCRAELTNTPIKVLAVTSNGRTVFAGTVTSLPNGFIELWLPRDLEINLTVEALGKKASGPISTFRTSDTCITTFQLR